MNRAGQAVAEVAESVLMVNVSGLSDGDDAADVDPDGIRRMVRDARAWQPRKVEAKAVKADKPRDWVEMADQFTKRLRPQLRYDAERAAWWEWREGTHWRDCPATILG